MGYFCRGTGKIFILGYRSSSHANRHLLWTYETTLINECNYTGGGIPYWDWSLDTSEYGRTMEQSPVFDPVTGFGGNGINGMIPGNYLNNALTILGSCIGDGPFVGLTSNLGRGFNLDTPRPHCIARNFNKKVFESSLQWEKNIVPLLKNTNFSNFTAQFEFPNTGASFGIHGAGHVGVGGEVCAISNVITMWPS
jgi:tyrosinase